MLVRKWKGKNYKENMADQRLQWCIRGEHMAGGYNLNSNGGGDGGKLVTEHNNDSNNKNNNNSGCNIINTRLPVWRLDIKNVVNSLKLLPCCKLRNTD